MDELGKRVCLDQIMFRACAVGGCELPQTDIFATYITEEIEKFINTFGFSEFTKDEFLFAIQLNAFGNIRNAGGEDMEQVECFGGCVNVAYLARIFKNYKVLRVNLDNKLKNLLKGY